jgi:hypothetical protein
VTGPADWLPDDQDELVTVEWPDGSQEQLLRQFAETLANQGKVRIVEGPPTSSPPEPPHPFRDAIAAAIHVIRGDFHDADDIYAPYNLNDDQKHLLLAAITLIKVGRSEEETLEILEELARGGAGKGPSN